MAITVAKLGFDLSVEGNITGENILGDPAPGNPATGRLGYEEWLQANVTTLHDVTYDQSLNIQVVLYE